MTTLLSEKIVNFMEDFKSDHKIVHFIASSKGYIPVDPPRMSNEIHCPFCGCENGYAPLVDVGGENRVWVCGSSCSRSILPRGGVATSIQTPSVRALEWHLFCEINGIGDEHYDVRFENINQSEGKLAYMLKFASAPRGIILMQGDPGTGKTYAAMGICEMFTRKSKAAVFTTQKQMSNNWLNSFKDPLNNYVNSVSCVPLLVIDDFGTGEPNPKFLEFFMDVINTRIQWKSRGTVITTNITPDKFALFCGRALSDRINTGQIFQFSGKTRRKQTIL